MCRNTKAKVEAACLVAQRWILAALRHRTFYHMNEMNAAVAPLLAKLNQRVNGPRQVLARRAPFRAR